MKITDIKLTLFAKSSILASGYVTFEDFIKIKCKIMNGKNGLFVKFGDSHKSGNKWYDSVIIKDRKISDLIQKQVLKAYDKLLLENQINFK